MHGRKMRDCSQTVILVAMTTVAAIAWAMSDKMTRKNHLGPSHPLETQSLKMIKASPNLRQSRSRTRTIHLWSQLSKTKRRKLEICECRSFNYFV